MDSKSGYRLLTNMPETHERRGHETKFLYPAGLYEEFYQDDADDCCRDYWGEIFEGQEENGEEHYRIIGEEF